MSRRAHIQPMRTLALALAAAAAASAAHAQSLDQQRLDLARGATELERHRFDLERNRIEQDLRAMEAAQYRLQTQMSQQAVRNSLYPDVPPIPLVMGGVSGLDTDPAASAEAARVRAEQARAQAVERRLQDIRGGPR